MSGLRKLAGSYKWMAFGVCVVVVAVLVGLGKAEYAQLVDFMKWGLGFVVGGRAVEEGLSKLGMGKTASTPTVVNVSPAAEVVAED